MKVTDTLSPNIGEKMTTAKNGDKVSVHYRGTLEDGSEFDSSHSRNTPLEFTVGSGNMIKGFDEAVNGMTVNETKNIVLEPSEAYGEVIEDRIMPFPKSAFPDGVTLEVGSIVQGADQNTGQPIVATIKQIESEEITLDFNHPLAGKILNFEIELLSIAQ